MRPSRYIGFLPGLVLLFAASQATAATITVINTDGYNEGFNDTASFSAIGNNYATTLGQARFNALQYAANLLGQRIVSNVAIRIDARMDSMGGNASSATLASAGPASVVSDFGAGSPSTWYPVALAEALKNSEINGSYDIVLTMNSDVDNSFVLGTTDWYYGLDGNAGSDNDFVTVAMHEILHGLGFLSVMESTGAMPSNQPDVYLNNLEHHFATPSDFPGMTDGQRLTAITDTGNLHWTGTQLAGNCGSKTGGKNGTHIYMYAPSPYESGSSVSHFSTSVTPNEMMEPFYTEVNHDPGLAIYVLQDIGWTTKTGSGSADLHLALDNSGTTSGESTTYTLTITNNGSNTAVETTVTYMLPPDHIYQTSFPAQGSCTHSNQVVSCSLGDLAASNATTVDIVVYIGSTITRTHAAIVSSATTESNDSDNTVADNTTPLPGVSASGCFIATAAWGSPYTREVDTLRRFRDQYLLTNGPGQLFVELYYRYSPPIAKWISRNEVLRTMMRASLGPLLALSHWFTDKD